MKKFLKILIGILVAIVLLLILAMVLAPKNLKINESIEIDAPAEIAFNMVNDLERWTLWSPWSELDPEAVYTYSDNTVGVGARFNWKGNEDVGEGSQTIIASSKPDSIRLALTFNGWDGESYSTWKFNDGGNKTKVSWDFEGSDTPFPFRPFNLIMKGPLKKSYRKGLENLKSVVEKRYNKKEYRGFKIQELEIEEKHYILRRQEVSFENMQQFYAQNLGALFSKVQEEGLEMDGMPTGLYFKWDPTAQKTDMAAAIPISEDVEVKDAGSLTIPQGRAIVIDFLGDYSGLEKAHMAMDEYMQDYGLFNNFPVVEEYVTDPGEQPDPEKWLTKIRYYISSN